MDPYSVLGVPRDATEEQVRVVHKRRARLLHPDLHANASADVQQEAAKAMQELNDAYKAAVDSPTAKATGGQQQPDGQEYAARRMVFAEIIVPLLTAVGDMYGISPNEAHHYIVNDEPGSPLDRVSRLTFRSIIGYVHRELEGTPIAGHLTEYPTIAAERFVVAANRFISEEMAQHPKGPDGAQAVTDMHRFLQEVAWGISPNAQIMTTEEALSATGQQGPYGKTGNGPLDDLPPPSPPGQNPWANVAGTQPTQHSQEPQPPQLKTITLEDVAISAVIILIVVPFLVLVGMTMVLFLWG